MYQYLSSKKKLLTKPYLIISYHKAFYINNLTIFIYKIIKLTPLSLKFNEKEDIGVEPIPFNKWVII